MSFFAHLCALQNKYFLLSNGHSSSFAIAPVKVYNYFGGGYPYSPKWNRTPKKYIYFSFFFLKTKIKSGEFDSNPIPSHHPPRVPLEAFKCVDAIQVKMSECLLSEVQMHITVLCLSVLIKTQILILYTYVFNFFHG